MLLRQGGVLLKSNPPPTMQGALHCYLPLLQMRNPLIAPLCQSYSHSTKQKRICPLQLKTSTYYTQAFSY